VNRFFYKSLLLVVMFLTGTIFAQAEDIGSVRTKFKVLGSNDRIVIEAFDDPDIVGATCYLSRAKTILVEFQGLVGSQRINLMHLFRVDR